MIRTVSDLAGCSAEEIESVRRSINIRGLYYAGARAMGRATGHTFEDYENWQKAPATEECRTCHGTGLYKKPMRSVGTIHASSAHMCVRKLYYDVEASRPAKTELSPELLITFSMGHGIHDVVQKALHVALPGRFRDEVKVDLDEAMILGSSTDGVIELDQARVLLEIKSIGKEFDSLKSPKPEHITQAVGIYAKALKVPFISFLYVSKSWPHNVKEFVVVYDEKVYSRWWKTKGALVEQALETGTAPIADATKDECAGCGYAYFCPQKL